MRLDRSPTAAIFRLITSALLGILLFGCGSDDGAGPAPVDALEVTFERVFDGESRELRVTPTIGGFDVQGTMRADCTPYDARLMVSRVRAPGSVSDGTIEFTAEAYQSAYYGPCLEADPHDIGFFARVRGLQPGAKRVRVFLTWDGSPTGRSRVAFDGTVEVR